MAFAIKQDGRVHELFPTKPDFGAAIEIVEVSPAVRVGWVFDKHGVAREPQPSEDEIDPSDVAEFHLNLVRNVFEHFADHDLEVPAEWKKYRISLRQALESGKIPKGGWPKMPAKPSYG